MQRRLWTLAIVVAAWLLTAAAPADAVVYCVHDPVPCPGTSVNPDKIQNAIDDATATLADDIVLIGPGTFNNEPFDIPVNTGGALHLQGSGTDATIFTSSGPSASERPQVLDAEATVSDLQIQVPS